MSSISFGTEGKTRSSILDDRRSWNQVVRGFRKGHNFGLVLGYNKAAWSGYLINTQQGDDATEQSTNLDFDYGSEQYDLQITYAFHIQIYGSLGYYLGTQLGGIVYEKSTDNNEDFKPPTAFDLPGISLGLVYDVTPGARVLLGASARLQRLDKFYHSPETAIITARVVTVGVYGDYFFSLTDGMRWGYEIYNLKFQKLSNPRVRRIGKSITLGWFRHLI